MRDSEFSMISTVEDIQQVFFSLVYSSDELTLLLDLMKYPPTISIIQHKGM